MEIEREREKVRGPCGAEETREQDGEGEGGGGAKEEGGG